MVTEHLTVINLRDGARHGIGTPTPHVENVSLYVTRNQPNSHNLTNTNNNNNYGC